MEKRVMFVDAKSIVDREGLRTYVLSKLQQLQQSAVVLCRDKKAFWNQVLIESKTLPVSDRDKVVRVLNQIEYLPEYLNSWISLAVDSPERFDFFVVSKANELHSGDQQKDYFWALQIRHDQLVALVRVLELLLLRMKDWVKERPASVFLDPVFSGLTEYGIEDQVYIEAEKVYKERIQLLKH